MKMKYYTNPRLPLYHMSFNPNLPDILYPRQPDGISENSKEKGLPDRVSFAPTLRQCWISLFYNIPENGRLTKEIVFNVYALDSKTPLEKLDPKLVYKHVWDSKFTDEVCVVEPCPIRYLGKVKIKAIKNLPILLDKTKPLDEDNLVAYEPKITVIDLVSDVKVRLT